jgi:ketosteroid isomerase-like protein
MAQGDFINKMYQAIDRKDTSGLMGFMTEDSIFRFANIPAVEGKDNIASFLDAFFAGIKSIRHSGIEYWNSGNAWFITGNVSYTRPDDFTLTVPFGVLLKMKGDLIKEYLVFVDNSSLYG